jgi:hypothetical protein
MGSHLNVCLSELSPTRVSIQVSPVHLLIRIDPVNPWPLVVVTLKHGSFSCAVHGVLKSPANKQTERRSRFMAIPPKSGTQFSDNDGLEDKSSCRGNLAARSMIILRQHPLARAGVEVTSRESAITTAINNRDKFHFEPVAQGAGRGCPQQPPSIEFSVFGPH